MASGSGWNLWVLLAGGGCGWNLWVWLVGVVSGCSCKEVYIYRFPHITYPYSSSIPTFCSLKKMFSFLFQYFFVIYVIIFSRSINTHTSDYRHPTVAL